MPDDTMMLDARVRLAILQGFIDGDTPSMATVAAALGEPASDVAMSFERLAVGRAIVLTPGTHEIRMAAPFAGKPTDFRATVAGSAWFANCIWDAMGIPAMLGASDARIETVCADCNTLLHLDLRDGGVTGDPTVVHFAVPAARWWENIVFT